MTKQLQSKRLSETSSYGLVVIARDTTGSIITRISSNRDLLGAIQTARSLLRLKTEAMRAEVHHREEATSDYSHKPLAALNRDDLMAELIR
jgi:hypothetical protein